MNDRVIKVCTADRMCFYVDADTLEPKTISSFDPWCFSDPNFPAMAHDKWLALHEAARREAFKAR